MEEDLTLPTLSQQTVYLLLEASFNEIKILPVTTSLLEVKLLMYQCESMDQQQRHSRQQG